MAVTEPVKGIKFIYRYHQDAGWIKEDEFSRYTYDILDMGEMALSDFGGINIGGT